MRTMAASGHEARPHVFPPLAGTDRAAAAPLCSTDAFLAALQREFAAVIGMACVVAGASCDRALEGTVFVRSDSSAFGIEVPMALAAALVSHRCGGALTGDHGAAAAASVVRLHGILCAAATRAASLAWPGSGDWQAGEMPVAAHRFGAALTIGDVAFDLAFAVTLPAAAAPANIWADALRHWLDTTALPVRAVLHEALLPLARAAALQPGDILPIEASREVCLRVARLLVARGSIAADDAGGHLVTVQSAARRGVQLSSKDTA